jgi:ribosome-associated protein
LKGVVESPKRKNSFYTIDYKEYFTVVKEQRRQANIDPKKIALRVALAAKSKKALNVVVLDMRAVCSFCDYFVIASGTSLRQVNAIAEALQEELVKDKIKSLSKVSSNDESGWIVLDYFSVVAHIFYKPMREFYSLEHLWSDAKRVRITKS